MNTQQFNTFTLTLTDLQLDLSEIYRNLGYRDHKPEAYITAMVDDMLAYAHEICHLEVAYIFFDKINIDGHFVTINDVPMKTGQLIAGYMSLAKIIAVFVVTAGREYDEYLHQHKVKDIVVEFFANAIGSEITEAAVRYVTQLIDQEVTKSALQITNSYSPGYCGWHVREQKQLFSLLPDNPCGIKLNNSSLMYPVKSVSGIVGLGVGIEQTPYACEICGMQSCFKRKIIL